MKLPVMFRWYETWFIALLREHKLEVLKNKKRLRKLRKLFAP
jgi:hypothetical protein